MSGLNHFPAADDDDDFGDFDDAFDSELESIDYEPSKNLRVLDQERRPKALVIPDDDWWEPDWSEAEWTDPKESPLYRDERNLALLFAAEGFAITPIGVHEPQEIPVSFIATKRSQGLAVVVTLTNPTGRAAAVKKRLSDLAAADRSSLPIFAAACLAAELPDALEWPYPYVLSMHANIKHYWKGMPKAARNREKQIGTYFGLLDTLTTSDYPDGLIKANNEVLSDAFLRHMKSKEYKELSLGKFPLPATPPKACHCEEDKRFQD